MTVNVKFVDLFQNRLKLPLLLLRLQYEQTDKTYSSDSTVHSVSDLDECWQLPAIIYGWTKPAVGEKKVRLLSNIFCSECRKEIL